MSIWVTRGSGFVCTVDDVLEMGVVLGIGRVCEMCMCFARGGVAGVWVR